MGMGHRKTSLTLYGMSITITVTSYLLSMWNVNIIMLFTVVLAVVILPGTGLKRIVKGWYTRNNKSAKVLESKSLPVFNKLTTYSKMEAKYDEV